MDRPTALLLDALHRDAARLSRARASGLSGADWQDLIACAAAQRVGGLLAERLKARGLLPVAPPEAVRSLQEIARATTIANLRLQGALRRVVDSLHGAGIRVIVLKGLHLAELAYGSLAARSMGDLDLMVPWADLGRAASVAERLGYQPRARYLVDTTAGPHLTRHLPPFDSTDAATIELHWNIADSGAPVDSRDLWARAVPVRLADRPVLALSAEDQIVHVCAHGSHAHHFEVGFRPLYDIAALIEHAGASVDWDAVVSRSRAWAWSPGLSLILRLASELVGAEVPPGIVERLGPEPPAAVYATAVTQMSAGPAERDALRAVTAAVASLVGQGPIGKLRTFARSVLLSRDALAQVYTVAPRSPALVFYYPVRLVDVVRRHAWQVVRTHRRSDQLHRLARRRAAIDRWLENR